MNKYLAFIGLSFWLLSCAKKEAATPPTSSADSTSAFLIDSVQHINHEDQLRLNGTVTFDQDSVVRVFPLVSGNIEKVNVSLGSFVQKGQDLALIRSGDISKYVNDYQADRSDLQVAQQTLKNVLAQHRAGFTSDTDLLIAQNNVKKAQDEASKSENILKVYGGNRTSGDPYFTVKAPITGYIVERNVNTGQDLRADNQTPLLVISNLQNVWVVANVYEQDIPVIRTGQSVDLSVLAYPDKVFKGIISNISSVLDTAARVLTVRIVLANQGGLLKPDMFASVRVHVGQTSTTSTELAVPQKAVVFDRDKYFVILQTGRQQYSVREVKVVKNTPRYSFIRGGALKVGNKVVTEGSLLLYNDLTN